MALNVENFILVQLGDSGNPDSIYPVGGPVASPVIVSINVCLELLVTRKVRAALLTIAKEVNHSQLEPDKWYSGLGSIESTVIRFIGKILGRFPTVYVDDSSINPGYAAAHVVHEWDYHFLPAEHVILVNGLRLRQMVAAAAAAKTMTQRSPDLRTYIFITASALLHELANLLVTYLTRGEMVTQRYMHSDIPYTAAHRGEAGQKLETILYGGTMVHYRDLGRDDEQPGIPYIRTRDGIRRLSRESIDATVEHRPNFPYDLEDPLLDPRSIEALGEGDVIPMHTNPLDGIITDEVRARGGNVYSGVDRTLRRLPVRDDLPA